MLSAVGTIFSSRNNRFTTIIDNEQFKNEELEEMIRTVENRLQLSYVFIYDDINLFQSRVRNYIRVISEAYVLVVAENNATSYEFLSLLSLVHIPNVISIYAGIGRDGSEWWFVETADRIGPDIEVLIMGTWRPSLGLRMEKTLFPYKLQNFHAMDVKIVGLEYKPGLYLTESSDGAVVTNGIDPWVLDEAAVLWNITYVFSGPSEPEWGIWDDSKGRYTGMIYDVFMGILL